MRKSLYLGLLLIACSSLRATSNNYIEQDTGRYEAPELEDDPETTNDESNDQPLRTSGTVTVCAYRVSSGNRYPLDADMDDGVLTTIYFQKGGNVDFSDCELDEDLYGECTDDQGRDWKFEGEC